MKIRYTVYEEDDDRNGNRNTENHNVDSDTFLKTISFTFAYHLMHNSESSENKRRKKKTEIQWREVLLAVNLNSICIQKSFARYDPLTDEKLNRTKAGKEKWKTSQKNQQWEKKNIMENATKTHFQQRVLIHRALYFARSWKLLSVISST